MERYDNNITRYEKILSTLISLFNLLFVCCLCFLSHKSVAAIVMD